MILQRSDLKDLFLRILRFSPYAFISCFISAFCACLVMWAVYSLPIDKIRNNTQDSIVSLLQSPKAIEYTFTGKKLDVFTDSIMLGIASINIPENSFLASIENRRPYFGLHPYYNLIFSLKSKNYLSADRSRVDGRFWNGYLALIKPLLVFLNLGQIRIINYVCQIILLLTALFFTAKKINFLYSIAFFIVILFINPISAGWCLEYSIAYYIMLLAVIYLLLNNKTDEMRVFLFTGIALAFFDFLVSPLITLGIPLVVLICLRQNMFKTADVISCCAAWFMGYAGMWFNRWVFITIFTPINAVQECFQHLWYRLFGDGSAEIGKNIDFSPMVSLSSNLMQFPIKVFFVVMLLYVICCYVVKKINKYPSITINTASILSVALLPFLWYIVVVNHSIIHSWITYRNLSVTIFALSVYIIKLIGNNKQKVS